MGGLEPGAATLTVLFTDLVGSTAMRSALGDVRADEIRRTRHDRVITDRVVAHDGTVVKGLGDGFMCAFPVPSRALACAAEIQKQIERDNAGVVGPEQVHVRMGLSVGEVSLEEGDLFGTPVVEASRLCNAADGGQILAADVVSRVAGSRATLPSEPFGALELKGLAAPLETVEVIWRGAELGPPPLPEPPGLDRRVPFVGRRLEFLALGAAWGRARERARNLAVVTGGSGSGVTRLVTELAAKVHEDEQALVLYGRCEQAVGYAYQPFAEALRRYVEDLPHQGAAARLGRLGAALDPLAPELGLAARFDLAPLEPLPPELARVRFEDAVTEWLSAAAADSPVLLVVDDAQWATAPTIDLLARVLRGTVGRKLLVALTYDPAAVSQTHPVAGLLGGLRAESHPVERVEVAPFDVEAAAALVDAVVDEPLGELSDWLAAYLVERVGGSPRLLVENVRMLLTAGVLRPFPPPATGWELHVTEVMPPPVLRTEAEAARWALDRVPEVTRGVLRVAAVLGVEFDERVLRTLSGVDEEAVAVALAEARAAGVLLPLAGVQPRHVFALPVTRTVLYDEVEQARRAVLHSRACDVLDPREPVRSRRRLAELARHAALAVVTDGTEPGPAGAVERAVAYAQAAGDRALAQFAAADAATWYRRAVEFGQRRGGLNEARRVELLVRLGEAERQAASPRARETLLEAGGAALRLGDVESAARAALGTGRDVPSQWAGPDQPVHDLLAEVATSPLAEPALRARVLGALAAESIWTEDAPMRFARSEEALSIARAVGDDRTLVDVLAARLAAVATADTVGERSELAAELEKLGRAIDDRRTATLAAVQTARLARELGDLRRSDDAMAEAEKAAAQLRLSALEWVVGLDRAARALFVGDLAAGERAAREALERGTRAGRPEANRLFQRFLLVLRSLQGRTREVASGLSDLAGGDPRLDGHVVARALVDVGRRDEAWPLYYAAYASSFSLGRTPLTAVSLANLSELAVHFGHREGADLLHDRLVASADLLVCGVTHQPAGAHYLGLLSGLLGEMDEAKAWFARAVEREDRAGAPLLAASSRVEWARMHLAEVGPGRERGVELARSAVEVAAAHGAAGLEATARAVLGQLAADSAPAAGPPPESPSVPPPVHPSPPPVAPAGGSM